MKEDSPLEKEAEKRIVESESAAPQLENLSLPDSDELEGGPAALVGQVLDNKIEIISLVGEGGMSRIYRARHLAFEKDVAVKVMHPHYAESEDAVRRFEQESRAAFALRDEHLVSVHDIGTTPDHLPYLVMDFVEGTSLSSVIEDGPLAAERALDIFKQVCAGLKAAHAQGVVHRDIKPSNILLETGDDGRELARISDFGIARVLTEGESQVQKLTQTGEMLGSPLYMSPEQCLGKPVDQRSDIYSLGCLMYECLTGRAPFSGVTAMETIMKHVNDEAPPLRHATLEAPLCETIMCCLEKDPEDRYQSIAELEKDLLDPHRSGRRRLRKKSGRKKMAQSATAVVLAAVTFLAAFWLWQNLFQPAFFAKQWQKLERQALVDFKAGPEKYDMAISKSRQAIALAGQDGVGADTMERLQWELGKYCFQTRDYKDAVEHLTLALKYNQNLPYVGTIEDHLGLSYLELKQPRKAVEHISRSVALKKRLYGRTASTLFSVMHLGDSYQAAGLLGRAEKTYKSEALPLASKLYPGEDDINLAYCYSNLGDIQIREEKEAEAIKNKVRALAIARKLLGPKSGYTESVLLSLARTYHLAGRLEESESTFREALPLARDIYGKGRGRQLGNAYFEFASLLEDRKKPGEAIDNFKKALDCWKTALGAKNEFLLRYREYIVGYMRKNGRGADADEILRRW